VDLVDGIKMGQTLLNENPRMIKEMKEPVSLGGPVTEQGDLLSHVMCLVYLC